MTETEIRAKQQAEWTKAHTLTPEQNKQLLLNKFRRAVEMHEALKRREMLVQKHR